MPNHSKIRSTGIHDLKNNQMVIKFQVGDLKETVRIDCDGNYIENLERHRKRYAKLVEDYLKG